MGNQQAANKRPEDIRRKDDERIDLSFTPTLQIHDIDSSPSETIESTFEHETFDILLKSACRGFLSRHFLHKRKAISVRRIKIVEEIASTEKSYCESLKVLVEVFYRPLLGTIELVEQSMGGSARNSRFTIRNKNNGKETLSRTRSVLSNTASRRSMFTSRSASSYNMAALAQDQNPNDSPFVPELSRDDVKSIFSQIEVIQLYNEKIAVAFQERLESSDWRMKISDIFLGMMDFLKSYIDYVNNYNTALTTLSQFKSIPEFSNWLAKAEKKPECKQMSIEALLIMPIQRTPRYVMLLDDLLRHTPDDHPDFLELAEATTKMKNIASLINNKKREAESFSKIVEIYHKLEPKVEDLCEAHRQYLREAEVKEDGKTFTFILFNDMLLKTRPREGKLSLLMHVSLLTIGVEDVQDDPKTRVKNRMNLVTPRRTIPVNMQSSEEKAAWIAAIRECKESLVQKSKSYRNLRAL